VAVSCSCVVVARVCASRELLEVKKPIVGSGNVKNRSRNRIRSGGEYCQPEKEESREKATVATTGNAMARWTR
jgi:hypothetical protein